MRFRGGILLLALAGCAAHAPAVVAVSPTPLVAARLHQGVVVSVRYIDLTGEPGARPGVDAVLAALRISASGAVSAQEIVVREADNAAVSIVAPRAPAFAVGDHVTIAEGGTTALVRN